MTLKDTIKNLAPKVKINGEIRDAVFWSVIIRLNPKDKNGNPIFRESGKVKTSSGKGKPATIWEIPAGDINLVG
jgi:hypothetical protein